MLRKSLKMLHLVGIIMFLGSVFGHVATGVFGGTAIGSPEFLAARENISALTQALTLPGLGLTIVSGLAMAVAGRMNPLRARWLGLHGALAVAVLAVAFLFVAPAGHHALDGALSARLGAASALEVQAAVSSERVFGSLNIVLSLFVIGVAVWKPTLRVARRHRA